MRTRPAVVSPPRLPRSLHIVLAAIVVVGLAMAGIALLAEAMGNQAHPVYLTRLNLPGGGPSAAEPSLVVQGFGRVSGPATTATLQLVVMLASPYGGGGSIIRPTPGATPGSGERDAVQPVLDALVQAGIPKQQIETVVSPALTTQFYGGAALIRLDITVPDPTLEGLNTVIGLANQAAQIAGYQINQVGAAYSRADCATLADQAWQAAVTDARTRAERQASYLGVQLGQVILASPADGSATTSGTEPTAPGTCLTAATGLTPSAGNLDSLTVPPFDPQAPAEAVAVARVNVGFAITPAPPE